MSEETTRWRLPLLWAGQAQKEVTHNEALAALDLLVQPAVTAAGLNTPPTAPAEGEAWIVGQDPVGDWAGRAGAVAGWTAGGWRFLGPREGMRAWVGEARLDAVFSGGAWRLGEIRGARVLIGGEQVLAPRQAAIGEPNGGQVVDSEARSAIAVILAALRVHGLITS